MAAEYRDAAEPAFLNAEALTPNERRWPYYLAHLYKLKGDATRADRVVRARPEGEARRSADACLARKRVSRPGTRGRGRAALRDGALDRSPLGPVLFGLGRTALAKQDYSRAIDYLEQALTLDPKAVVIHFPLAMAYRGMGDVPKAEAHLRVRGPGDIRPPDPLMQELDAILESAVAYEVRGAAALDESNWVAAADYFRKGIALAPNEPSLRHKLGTALAMSGDPRAVEQFEEVTRRWPKFAKAQYSLGLILASSGRNREAIEHFSAAVKGDPAYSEARLQLAEMLRVSGRFQESLPQYRRRSRSTRVLPRHASAMGWHSLVSGGSTMRGSSSPKARGFFQIGASSPRRLNSLSAAGSSR